MRRVDFENTYLRVIGTLIVQDAFRGDIKMQEECNSFEKIANYNVTRKVKNIANYGVTTILKKGNTKIYTLSSQN